MAKKKKKTVKKKTSATKKKNSIKKKLVKKKSVAKSSKAPKSKATKKTIAKKTIDKKVSKKSLTKPAQENKIKKIPKAISGFDDKIKEIFAKLINKHKVDGIYTQKIIEKAIPKKFRLEENIKKFVNLITSNNIKIHSEEEAKELIALAKEQTAKTEEGVR